MVVDHVDESSPDPIRLGGIAKVVADRIESDTGLESRFIVLGHVQRRGTPPAFDRILATAKAAARPPREEETIVLDEFLAGIERELITRALKRAKGNKAQSARLLGMTRPRLYRRMVQLGLEDA